MIKYFSTLIVILIGITNSFSQNIPFKEYKSDDFEISYPAGFKVDTIDNMISFYNDPTLGDITISINESQHLSKTELREIVANINEKKEANPDIKITDSKKEIVCAYNFTTDRIKYFVKVLQNDKKMYMITLNWNEDSFEQIREVLLGSFDSFIPK